MQLIKVEANTFFKPKGKVRVSKKINDPKEAVELINNPIFEI